MLRAVSGCLQKGMDTTTLNGNIPMEKTPTLRTHNALLAGRSVDIFPVGNRLLFQEIVNSVYSECANGMRIVSRDEDINRSGADRWLHIFDDSKTSRSGICTSRKTMSG
jgi:hypothetical protein